MADGNVNIRVALNGARETAAQAKRVATAIDGVDRSATRARVSSDRSMRSSQRMGAALKTVGVAAGVAAGALATYAAVEIKKSISQTVEFAKETIKLQDALGGSAEDNSRLVAVFKSRGITTDSLFTATTRLAKAVGAAQEGTGNAAESFKAFGVSQEELKKSSPIELFMALSDGFKEMGPGLERTRRASELFGRGWMKLRPILKLGGNEIQAQIELAGKLGNKLTEKNLTDAGKFIKAQRDMGMALDGLRIQIGIRLLPYLSKGAKAVSKFMTEVLDGGKNMSSLARSTRRVIHWVKKLAEDTKNGRGSIAKFASDVKTIGSAAHKTAKFMKDLYDNSALLRAAWKVAFKLNLIVVGQDAIERAKNTIRDIKNLLADSPGNIIKRLLPNSGFGPTGRRGGRVTNGGIYPFAYGGRVPGSRVAGDTVPAMLSPGEFVVTRSGEAMLNSLTGIPGVLNHIGRSQRAHFGSGGRVTPIGAGAMGSGRPIITKVYLDRRQIAEAVGSEVSSRRARR